MSQSSGRKRRSPKLSLCLDNIKMMSEVVPGLYIGDRNSLYSKEFESNGISAVVTCMTKKENFRCPEAGDYRKYFVDLPDTATAALDMYDYFRPAAQFIRQEIQRGGTVLVHCSMGLSRSPTIVLAYLILHHSMSLGEAFGLVEEKYHFIVPRDEFKLQLLRLESECVGNSMSIMISSPDFESEENFIGRSIEEKETN